MAMKFVDLVMIQVEGGQGGNGCTSFRREKFVPRGGPDGGNGGRGGGVILEASLSVQTLADFEYHHRYAAAKGENGRGKRQYGRSGSDLVIPVPCGTLVYDEKTGDLLADLVEPGDRFLAARGGKGGRGNATFANSVRRAPHFSEKGDPGEKMALRLELKLIADIGLVGLPNVGKSALLAAISNAQPKIADYPFTTLSPNLGILDVDDERIIIADVPGLIEGAHQDRGLGITFLRHIERTRLLVHVLDLSAGDLAALLSQREIICQEFTAYDQHLLDRPYMVVANKIDLEQGPAKADALEKEMKKRGIAFLAVSALRGDNIPGLVRFLAEQIRHHPRPHGETRLVGLAAAPVEGEGRHRLPVEIFRLNDGSGFRIVHPYLEKVVLRFDFDQEEALSRFSRILRRLRIDELLLAQGAKEGDTVFIGDMEFDFEPERALEVE